MTDRDTALAIEARQHANGCNRDGDPDAWGVPCCAECVCEADEGVNQ